MLALQELQSCRLARRGRTEEDREPEMLGRIIGGPEDPGAVVAGNAMNEAAKAVRQKILKLAAEHFECAGDDLEIADGEW
jgi:hypothetical protein